MEYVTSVFLFSIIAFIYFHHSFPFNFGGAWLDSEDNGNEELNFLNKPNDSKIIKGYKN